MLGLVGARDMHPISEPNNTSPLDINLEKI